MAVETAIKASSVLDSVLDAALAAPSPSSPGAGAGLEEKAAGELLGTLSLLLRGVSRACPKSRVLIELSQMLAQVMLDHSHWFPQLDV